MPGSRDHLQVVGGRRLRVRPQPRMQVATQAIFAGPQDHRVFAMTPQATGRGYGHIAVRVGRILVYLESRTGTPYRRGPPRSAKPPTWPTQPSDQTCQPAGTSRPATASSDGAGCAGSTTSSRRSLPSLQQQQMTMSDLPIEGPRPTPVQPTTSSTQPASQKPTDTGSAAGWILD